MTRLPPVILAVIGAGGAGRTHIENLRTMPGVRIAAVCDPSPDAAAIAASLGAAHCDLDAVLGDNKIDAALICTPTHLHEGQVRRVLQSGRACICEKPLCLSSAGADALFALAAANGTQLYIGQVVRFFEAYELAAEYAREGRLGRLLDASLHRLTARPAWQKDGWLFDPAKSGLIPFDLHIHDLDFLVSVLGAPDAFTAQRGGADAQADYYRVLYRFGRVTACAEAAWYRAPLPFTQGYRLYFEEGVLCYDGRVVTLYAPDAAPRALLEADGPNTRPTGINVTPTNAFYREMEHFLDCIRRGAPSERITRAQVVAVLRTLEALDRS